MAARIVICPPDLKPEHLPAVIERAAINVVVSDDPALAVDGVRFEQSASAATPAQRCHVAPSHKTEWVLFTCGTTGVPKMVAHTLEGLTGAIAPGAHERRGLGHLL